MFRKVFLTALLCLPQSFSMEYEFGRVLLRKKVRTPSFHNLNMEEEDDWRREDSWRYVSINDR